jgi:hypothetical protein
VQIPHDRNKTKKNKSLRVADNSAEGKNNGRLGCLDNYQQGMSNGRFWCLDNYQQGMNNGRFWDGDNYQQLKITKRIAAGSYSSATSNGRLAHKLFVSRV